ncbi:hypothetical protein BDZ91DRAFT_737765 [Kalaharituber pfeilii]|nr:hypothetical protein BDZ91DRAFT_737765 [Kalaharituber pfeilii]
MVHEMVFSWLFVLRFPLSHVQSQDLSWLIGNAKIKSTLASLGPAVMLPLMVFLCKVFCNDILPFVALQRCASFAHIARKHSGPARNVANSSAHGCPKHNPVQASRPTPPHVTARMQLPLATRCQPGKAALEGPSLQQ